VEKLGQYFKVVLWIGFGTGLSSCLVTRNEMNEIEQKKVMQEQVIQLQKNTADQTDRFNEINEDMRSFNGRLEVIENRLTKLQEDRDKEKIEAGQHVSEQDKKILLLQEEMVKLEAQIQALAAAVESKSAAIKMSANSPAAGGSPIFTAAEELFGKKDWANAILKYSEYRDANPKGKRFTEATFKIASAFESLGKKKEAKVFYEEVIERSPQSSFANRAREKLKKLK
jgi:TolA-binding protein